MYEDEKNEQGGVMNNSYSNSQNYGGSQNYNNSPNYSSSQNYTGGQSYGSSYTSGQTGNNSFSYGGAANSGNGYNSYSYGNGNSQSNSYGYNNGSYSYNPNGTQSYGTYQYGGANSGAAPVPPKKKNTFGKVVAAIAILALLVGGVGASYYVVNNSKLFTDKSSDVVAQVEDKQEETTTTDSSSETKEPTVKTTTVTAETKAVVTDVTAVVEEVMPAMVIIHNNYTQSASYFGYVQTQEATASGSGIIVGENDTELLIATNYHVIEGADSLEVIFNDDSTVEAVVKGTSSDMDLAVIAVMLDDISSDTLSSIKVATLGDSNALVLGEPAIAIGNALGYGQSVTTGVISALNRQVELDDGSAREFIQTDAAINPGNSGGALLNLQGEVIGINSNKIGGNTVEGMGYAIPISEAKPIIDKLMNEETKIKVSDEERGYIGISGVSVTSEVSQVYGLPEGVYVAEVSNGGGAQFAGIEKGDVIVGFDGEEITSMDDLQTRLQYYKKGTQVTVTVMRQNGSEYVEENFDVTLGGAASGQSQDSNAAESDENSQYDGNQQPALPSDKNSGNSQHSGGH